MTLQKQSFAHKVAQKPPLLTQPKLGPQDLTYGNSATSNHVKMRLSTKRMYVTSPRSCHRKRLDQSHIGTFEAFIENWTIQRLGRDPHPAPSSLVLHVNEFEELERFVRLARSNSNANWGYDPQNHSPWPVVCTQAILRIQKTYAEFKNHQRNPQTWHGCHLWCGLQPPANVDVFEDIEPKLLSLDVEMGTPTY